MVKKLPELSIFFPFWNEEENIEAVVESAIPIAKVVADKWEILMIDDGSSDKTRLIAEKLASKHKNLRVISHNPNRGYGASLKDGLLNSQYEYIVFTDGDRQFDFSEVTKFIEKIRHNDIVIGYRKKRQDKFIRYILMYLLKVWDFVLFGFYFKDIDGGFKMFRRHAVEQLKPLQSEGAMITTEILAKAKRKKLKIEEVGVTHYPREFGESSGGNMYIVIRAILESLILWWDIKNGRI
jgi:glycosyltransferase involved in cell wall biosynthesis